MQLTQAQLVTLKNAINANTDPAFVAYREAGATGAMADWYNVNSAFVVWKWSVTIVETGEAFNGSEWAGMTSANIERLACVATYLSRYNPSDSDVRAMFNDIWSGAGGQITRANLLALWKRFALKGEQLYCTGTGTDAVPGVLNATAQGDISNDNIVQALAA
jgi:hypothetical protein